MKIIIDGPNRTRASLKNGTMLFISYETCVAARLPDGTRVRTETIHSRTTSKQLGEWGMADVERKPQEFFDNLLDSI